MNLTYPNYASHTFPLCLVQKLIIALNPIWRPTAILGLEFPWSDLWEFLGSDYWGIKCIKSDEKTFVRIFHSQYNCRLRLTVLAAGCPGHTVPIWRSRSLRSEKSWTSAWSAHEVVATSYWHLGSLLGRETIGSDREASTTKFYCNTLSCWSWL